MNTSGSGGGRGKGEGGGGVRLEVLECHVGWQGWTRPPPTGGGRHGLDGSAKRE